MRIDFQSLLSRRENKRIVLALCVLCFSLLWLSLAASSQAKEKIAAVFQSEGLAIRGYDPVAYFTQKKAVAGKEEHSMNWKGTTWRFANAEHLRMFQESPERYAPRYGGYCAYAVSRGYTASTVPEAWTIVDDRLYLNYSLPVKRLWMLQTQKYIRAGDANWPQLLEE